MPLSTLRLGIAFYMLVAASFFALGISGAFAEQPANTPTADKKPSSHIDCFGDPLPAGAMLRLGTTRLRQGDDAEGVAFSPDGRILASAGMDESINFWDTATG